MLIYRNATSNFVTPAGTPNPTYRNAVPSSFRLAHIASTPNVYEDPYSPPSDEPINIKDSNPDLRVTPKRRLPPIELNYSSENGDVKALLKTEAKKYKTLLKQCKNYSSEIQVLSNQNYKLNYKLK
jgi:hypothetical protein